MCSIIGDLVLFFPSFEICETRRKIPWSLKIQSKCDMNCPNYSWFRQWLEFPMAVHAQMRPAFQPHRILEKRRETQ